MANKRGDIDWRFIKQEYIAGHDSYRKLAAKYNLTEDSVERIGRREGWARLRKEYRDAVLVQTMEKLRMQEADEAAGRLLKLQSATDRMAGVINRVLDDSEQFYRHMVKDRAGEVSCETYEKVDTKAIRDLMVSLKDLTSVIRDLYDLPTLEKRQAMELAREKLDMEKEKRRGDEVPDTMTVTFENGMEDYAG